MTSFFFLTHLDFHPCPTYLQVSGRSDQNWIRYGDDKVKQMLFQQSRGRNSKINDPIWPVFKHVRDFIHAHLSCKFQAVTIKTEQVIVMTKSHRGFFSNQGNVTLILMIQSGQILNLSEISSMSTLRASINQGAVTKINDQIWPVFKFYRDFTHAPVPLYLQVSGSSDPKWMT